MDNLFSAFRNENIERERLIFRTLRANTSIPAFLPTRNRMQTQYTSQPTRPPQPTRRRMKLPD